MKLIYNYEKMMNLMKDFYTLTEIMIVLFDTDMNTLLVYPEEDCAFCAQIKKNPQSALLCKKSDTQAFQLCQKQNACAIYTCHAGLTESCTPLTLNDKIIGYLMFGHICDMKHFDSRVELNHHLHHYLQQFDLDISNTDLTTGIAIKTVEEVQSATNIINACTRYLILEHIIQTQQQDIINAMKDFILAHIDEDLSVDRICNALGVSRRKLYNLSREGLGKGIAEFILELRLEHARTLLKNTRFSITRIAELCGFNDYNYFCRVFKKRVGSSAKKYRQNAQS